MTTYPDAAMLDALSKYDKAVDWRKYNRGSMDRLNDVLDAARMLADAARALASTRQEPAPAAEVEEVASECIKNWERISAPVYNRDLLVAAIVATLRRCAGDGVTDVMVGALKNVLTARDLSHARTFALYALEAAARASGEKGGAR